LFVADSGENMNFTKPKDLEELLQIIDKKQQGKRYLLAGGTDINVQIKHGMIKNADIIYINGIDELKGIKKENGNIIIGALTTFDDIINAKLPFLSEVLMNFASPIIQTIATIGGNIANASPTNDVSPPLLVLDASLVLASATGQRVVPLKDFYQGYKVMDLKENEIIHSVILPEADLSNCSTLYQKVGARKTLTIAKAAIAGIKQITDGKFTTIKLAVGSLNEYPRRLHLCEQYLKGLAIADIDYAKLKDTLQTEITPISDLRSDEDYRFAVCWNLIEGFVG
jgi:CO/xanthine dehydrogenase FAD-binding subunit